MTKSLCAAVCSTEEVTEIDVVWFLAELYEMPESDLVALQISHVLKVLYVPNSGFVLACAMHVPFARCAQCKGVAPAL